MPESADRDSAVETKTLLPSSSRTGQERFYLLVFEGGSSHLHHLPRTGSVLIGRGDDADLRLQDAAASRRHARITIADGEARITDLDSHNGTKVNGETITSARPLSSGDVISICGVTLVLHGSARTAHRTALDLSQLRQRLEEEIARGLEYERPLTLCAVALGSPEERTAAVGPVIAQLRMMDLIAVGGEAQLLALLPELSAAEGARTARRLLDAVEAVAPAARVGVATCPEDGADADTLLAAARAAAAAARPGQVARSSETATRIELGDRWVVVADPAMVRLYDLIQRLAASELPLLIQGETGSGKENAAFAAHHWSPRRDRPFVTLNCAALPENLVESELFGYERGAFSGATAAKTGLLEAASGGTVFLDEIGELPAPVQAKLLRALEQKRITRLGEVRERQIDLRVVAATNRNLEEDVQAGRFRQDLFFRLGAATVILPPLRDRPREVPILARTFLEAACERLGRAAMTIAPPAMQRLLAYAWPGNVRELKNVMDFAAAAVQEPRLELWHLPERISGKVAARRGEDEPTAPGQESLPTTQPEVPVPDAAAAEPKPKKFRPIGEEIKELERRRMEEALEASGGVQTRAAELIGMPLRTFVLKLKQHGIVARRR
jgi:DNA-binding NtrC family response regulator